MPKWKKGSNLKELARLEVGSRTYLFGRGTRAKGEPTFFCITERGRSTLVVEEVYLEDFREKLGEAIKAYGPIAKGASICPGFMDRKWRVDYSRRMDHALQLHPPKPNESGTCEICGYEIGDREPQEDTAAKTDNASTTPIEGPCPGLSNKDWLYICEYDLEGGLKSEPELFATHDFVANKAKSTVCAFCTFDSAEVNVYEDTARELRLSEEGEEAGGTPSTKRVKGRSAAFP